MSAAVRVYHLGKEYQIGARMAPYTTLRERIGQLAGAPLHAAMRLAGRRAARHTSTHWALRDVSFEVERGTTLGIIGHNGAGKSTLLKILSRITEPTSGRAEIDGRVASLLEVGTGFHPELTGRENVFLNGAILGMRRAETARKFDEIVAFAEIEKFIDTPVKFYSSGMYLRLAFAVAAHLEPEILIVDEVLAVGDVRFQKKCLNKMQDVSQDGRTVLFVSHSMPAITRLCKRAVLLDQGRVAAEGPVQQVVGAYLNSHLGSSAERTWDELSAPSGASTRLRAVRVRTEQGHVSEAIDIRQPFQVEMEFEVTRGDALILPHVHFFNEEDIHLFCSLDSDPAWRRRPRPPGRYVSRAWVPGNLLAEGTIFLHFNMVSLKDNVEEFSAPNAITIQVIDNLDGDSARVDWPAALPGVMRPLLRWTTEYLPAEGLEAKL